MAFTQIEYDETMELARRLKNEAGSASDSAAGKGPQLSGTLNPGWQGTSGDLMTEVFNMYTNKQKKITQNIQAVAGQIEMVANALMEADKDAAGRNRNA